MKTSFFSIAAASLALAPCSDAQFVTVEPDNYTNGTALTTIVPEVTLTTVGTANQFLSVLFVVQAVDTLLGFASTGTRVFAHAGIDFWPNTSRLRMDFSGLVSTLSLDFIGGDFIRSEVGRLEAYNQSNELVATYLTSQRPPRQSETMTIARASADIAWAVAYTNPGEGSFGVLDHLTFSTPVPVPEPTTFGIAGLGLLAWAASHRLTRR